MTNIQLRIDSDKVSNLMDIVGELSLAVNEVTNNKELDNAQLEDFHIAAHKLSLLVQDIQSCAANLSMVPIGGISNKLRKLIRDLSKQTGKTIEFELYGQDVEIDKSVLDNLQEPLMHIIRNSIDHGIEDDILREQLNKPKGKVIVKALQQGSEIHIIIKDNGRGLNKKAILEKAKKQGIIKQTDNIPDEQVWRYILHPGFSTAEKVTNLSGRGVGMDVVNTIVTNLRGRLVIDSNANHGTTMIMQIPLSLSYLECLIVKAKQYLHAIPIDVISEVFRPDVEDFTYSSENNCEIIRLRDDMLPIRRIEEFYDFSFDREEISNKVILVVKSTKGNYAIPVDEIIGQQQVTMKPATGMISQIRANAGCAILNSGDIAITLDCEQMVRS